VRKRKQEKEKEKIISTLITEYTFQTTFFHERFVAVKSKSRIKYTSKTIFSITFDNS
jgi:hypothetical protein